MSLERITIEPVPEFMSLEKSADDYFKAKYNLLPLLKNMVISPFEKLLKEYTGFSTENLPEETTTTELKLGDITFSITSSKKVKKPKVSETYNGLVNYLTFLKEGYQKGIGRKGVKTFGQKPYVLLDDIFTKLDELKKEVTLDNIKQSLSHDYSEEYSGRLVIPLSGELSLSESDALLYVRAKLLEEILRTSTVKPYEEKLKKQTGYSKNNVPEKMKTKCVQVQGNLIIIKSIPESTVKYTNLFNSLIKEPPKKVTKRTKIGELVAIRDDHELKPELISFYQPKSHKNQKYISINGFLERLKQLKELNTNPSLNQKIDYYPAI